MTTEIACPHCQATIAKLVIAKLSVEGERHSAVLLCCPLCNHVLATQFDPLSVAAEVRDSLLRELKNLLAKPV
jgi:hypothetical protein